MSTHMDFEDSYEFLSDYLEQRDIHNPDTEMVLAVGLMSCARSLALIVNNLALSVPE